jgi:geranylgeranyl diphosphate synthase, type II
VPFDLDGYLFARRERVERALDERLGARSGHVPPRLLEAMRYSLLGGGKRVRAVLCLTFADAAASASEGGGRVAEDAACALEMVHAYSLIHDDLPAMDDDELRRGKPTSHRAFGEAMAILAGDALLTAAFETLAGGTEPVRLELCAELSRAAGATGMIAGQVLDIAEDRPAELRYLTQLHELKTGALIKASCVLGALAGGGAEAALRAARAYGDAVGLVFQIADDLLDVTGSSQDLGKPVGADQAAGRTTFPALVGVAQSRQHADERIKLATDAVRQLEPSPGPLAALAQFALTRRS